MIYQIANLPLETKLFTFSFVERGNARVDMFSALPRRQSLALRPSAAVNHHGPARCPTNRQGSIIGLRYCRSAIRHNSSKRHSNLRQYRKDHAISYRAEGG